MIARLVIAVSVALALFPVAYHAYDRWLYRWIGPEVHFNHRIEISRPRQVEPTLHGYCALAMLTGFVALALWYGVARHNAEIVAQGMTWPTFSPFAVPLLLVVGGLLFCFADIEDFSQLAVGAALLGCASLIYPYLKLDEIWRASDPKVLVSSEAWKERNPSWLVGAWGLSLFTATWLFILPTPEWAANVNVAITGIVMTTIVRSVTRRQQVRYRRLYGKDSTHT